MYGFDMYINLRYSNCVIDEYTYIKANLGSNRHLFCNFLFFLMTGYRRHCTLKSQLLLVIFILFYPNFRLIEIVLPWYFLHTFNFVQKL